MYLFGILAFEYISYQAAFLTTVQKKNKQTKQNKTNKHKNGTKMEHTNMPVKIQKLYIACKLLNLPHCLFSSK